MLRSTLQTDSFAKIAHRAIFKLSVLAGAGILPRFGFTAPAFIRSSTPAVIEDIMTRLEFRDKNVLRTSFVRKNIS